MARRLFVLFVFALFIYVIHPFLVPVTMGAVLSVLLIPGLDWMEKKKVSSVASSLLLTFAFTLVVLLPSAFLIFSGAKAGFQQIQAWKDTPKGDGGLIESIVNIPTVRSFMSYLTDFFSVDQTKLIEMGQDLARGIGIKAADLLGEMVAYLPSMMMGMAVMTMSIYFFLVDGRSLAFFIRRNSFFGSRETDQLIQAVGNMCRSVILASVVSALAQAFVFTLVSLIVGVPNPAFIGTLVLIASFIPIVGSAPITIAVAVQAFIAGTTGTGIVLLIAAVVAGAIDNFIRPVFLKGSTNLHPMLAFLAALGGLQSVGFLGVFLGPIVAALFVVTIEILTQSNDGRPQVS